MGDHVTGVLGKPTRPPTTDAGEGSHQSIRSSGINMGNTTGHGEKLSAHEPSVLLEVEDVNKRTLGKLIIKTVGHKGTETDEEGTYLRRQIQACISNLEHHKPALWKDARVSFYGLRGHEYVIQSGDGRHRFVVFLDAKDEVTLTKRK